jgi:peptidoglycan/xylan/chitin deacetylase (PgdA/CDA1 family)
MIGQLLRSKGLVNLLRRAWTIVARTGVTPARMRHALLQFADLLDRHGAQATFPVTAVALARHPGVFRQVLTRAPTVELAIHGHRHVDLTMLSDDQQATAAEQAAALFRAHAIPFVGFRAPYLRWNDSLLTALEAAHFWYDSSQSILWPALDGAAMDASQSEAVRLLREFCQPLPAEDYPALPHRFGRLLEIPVSLPDDEMLVERLRMRDNESIASIWLAALRQCHARNELFVLQLHPERFPRCAEALQSVLQQAQTLRPRIWFTNLRGVTTWWQQKREMRLDLLRKEEGLWEIAAEGPHSATLLVRDADVPGHSASWSGSYQRVTERRFVLQANHRPGVGVSPAAPLELVRFLTDQGYPVEVTDRRDGHAVYVSQESFGQKDMLPLLTEIEAASGPMVRWACWPDGAGSAMAVSGDVDALTIWDYLKRPFGR